LQEVLERPLRVSHQHDTQVSVGFSILLHLLLFGIPYYLLVVRQPPAVVMELDLTQAPRGPKPVPHRSRAAAKQVWTAPKEGLAPAPSSATESAAAEETPACPPPCPDTPGAYTPAALTAQAPRLVGDFLTDADYPKLARRAGQDGRVLLTVFIEADGHVREARLVKGSYPVLNNVALEKIRTARFEPARDAAGRPVPSKVLLPIRFELN